MGDPWFNRPVAGYVNNFKPRVQQPSGQGSGGSSGARSGQGVTLYEGDAKFKHPAEMSFEELERKQAEEEALRQLRIQQVRGKR